MTELICDREFGGAVVDGKERRIVVEWFKPYRHRGDWRCDWTIHRPDPDMEARQGYTVGVDSADALLLAMALVADLVQSDYPEAFWLEPGHDLGLPGLPGR